MKKIIYLLGILFILLINGCDYVEQSLEQEEDIEEDFWEGYDRNEICRMNNGITIDGECDMVWKFSFNVVNITPIKIIYEEDFSEIEDKHDRILKVKCMENKTCYHFTSYEALVKIGNTEILCYVINNTKYSTIDPRITSEELKKQFPRVKIEEGCFREELYNIDRYGFCMENYYVCELR